MRKIIVIGLISLFVGSVYSQDIKKDSVNGVVNADQVKVSKTGKAKEKIDAGLRAKAKELTRDLLEKGRLQFEPEYGRYHGYMKNLHNEKYTKKATNTAYGTGMNGQVSGWHEDKTGGDFTGKPVIQIFDGHFYCNLDIILTQDTQIPENSARNTAVYKLSQAETSPATTGDPKTTDIKIEPITTYDSEETLNDLIVFNSESYEITNIQNPNEYITTFDVIVKQPFTIENTYYEQFTFQCAMNILNAKMAVRIIAGKDRICTTYHGDMNYIQGGSF